MKALLQIQEDKTITAAEIAQKIGISSRGVEKNLAKLKREGVLNRTGATKKGFWEILVKLK